jgi:hypothetical protein
MSITWELVKTSIADAQRADDLVHELAFRRELRIDPDKALAAFALWRRPAARPVEVGQSVVDRRLIAA